jgi:uncharacterized protein DUF3810
MPDRPLRLFRRAFLIVSSAAFLGALWVLARFPIFVEDVYARRVSFHLGRALSLLSGYVPISLAEIALAGVLAYFLIPFITTTMRVLRRQRSVVNAMAGGVLRVATAAAVILCVFYLTWGLNYARAPLQSRLGWPAVERAADPAARQRQVDELAAFAAQLVEATNAAYREVTGTTDLGRPSERPPRAPSYDEVLEPAYARVQERLGLEPAVAAARGRAKTLIASEIMNYLGLAGFYFPWTGEANYNRRQPGPTLPHSVAHEKAHQRGIAPEDEAGFVGYLACALSDDAYTRYSGALFAQRQLLGELGGHDPARARELLTRRLPGVQRDVDYLRAFWERYEGTASRVSFTINDRYLKSQGMKGGMTTYAASRNLIVLFARQNGGRAWIGR